MSVVDCPPVSEAEEGVTVIMTRISDIDVVSFLLGSATLAAFTVTVCAELTMAGAV